MNSLWELVCDSDCTDNNCSNKADEYWGTNIVTKQYCYDIRSTETIVLARTINYGIFSYPSVLFNILFLFENINVKRKMRKFCSNKMNTLKTLYKLFRSLHGNLYINVWLYAWWAYRFCCLKTEKQEKFQI